MRRAIIIASVFISVIFLVECKSSTHKGGPANDAQQGNAEILFREYEHHFGKVSEGEKVSWQFTFENKGSGPLVLKSVTTTCGCTVPKYDTKPIEPGGKGSLEVVFDTSDRNGMQTKTISVSSNASVPVVLLKITAEVEPRTK
jgi:hypothetical protein